MRNNITTVFFVASLLCIAVYIGVFIGRTQNTIAFSQTNNINANIVFEKIDLNEATFQELTAIPGIDSTIALAIIEYRETYGPYYKLKELLYVEGVTEILYEILKDYVCVKN